jgi:hypothetical protein
LRTGRHRAISLLVSSPMTAVPVLQLQCVTTRSSRGVKLTLELEKPEAPSLLLRTPDVGSFFLSDCLPPAPPHCHGEIHHHRCFPLQFTVASVSPCINARSEPDCSASFHLESEDAVFLVAEAIAAEVTRTMVTLLW